MRGRVLHARIDQCPIQASAPELFHNASAPHACGAGDDMDARDTDRPVIDISDDGTSCSGRN